MKKNKLTEFGGKIMKFTETHQREITLGFELTGIILTGIACWNAGIKADKILKEQKEKMESLQSEYERDEMMEDEEFDKKKRDITIETVKRMAPVVASPVIIGTTTLISAGLGYAGASKEIAALSAAYNISEKKLSDYQDKAKEMFGEKKARAITDEVNADKIKNNPPAGKKIFNTGKGETLCYDDQSGRYFYSDAESIRNSVNKINDQLNKEYYVSLNEFYNLLGLPDITLGDDTGFNIDDGLIDIDHLFSATLTADDTPCLVLNYDVSPSFTEHRGKMFG